MNLLVSTGVACLLGCLTAAPLASAQTAQPERAGGRFVVVLDAAHGGDDSGARLGADGSVAEKNVTLALSVRLRSLLMARGIAVVTTREGNVTLDADGRAQIANRATAAGAGAGNNAGSAVCLSLHATQMGSGVHLFVSALEPVVGGRFLPWKTAQAAFVSGSVKLAGVVNSALAHGEADGGAIPATLKRASLPGLDSMTCPAVAIELAPIRGDDRQVVTEVTDADYQTQFVQALAAALLEWKSEAAARPGDGPGDGATDGPARAPAEGRTP